MKKSFGRKFAYIFITGILITYLIPLFYIISVSLRKVGSAFSWDDFWRRMTLENYAAILGSEHFMTYLRNSLIVSTGATLVCLVLGLLAAYSFSRLRLWGKEGLFVGLLSIRVMPPVLIAIAYFDILVRFRLYDTMIALILLNSLLNMPLAIWVLRNYLQAVPRELDEAAMMDGCSRLTAIRKILVPLCAPGLAAVAVQTFVLSWNEYLFALVFITSNHNKPATVAIFDFIGQWSTNYIGIMAFAVLMSLPVVIAFLAVQRYIVKGLLAGSDK